MSMPAPPIDRRSYADLVAQTERLLRTYSDWEPSADGSDPAAALVRIFARLGEVVVDRLNQVPEKNFLAFLNLLGLEPMPPQAARAPLTFALATGSTSDASVPARTLISAAPAERVTGPVVFETERELHVTCSQLVAAYTLDPGRDRYTDSSEQVTGADGGAFAAFQGNRAIEHRLYLGHKSLFGMPRYKDITLSFAPDSGDNSWLQVVEWSFSAGGAGWKPVARVDAPVRVAGAWQITLRAVPPLGSADVAGQSSAWLSARLATPLPRGGLREGGDVETVLRKRDTLPDAIFSGGAALFPGDILWPFGEDRSETEFYLACDDAFSKPDAEIEMAIELAIVPRAGTSLKLKWEYLDRRDWQPLGESSPTSSSLAQPPHSFVDTTRAFTQGGSIGFRRPSSWSPGEVEGVRGRWLRVRIEDGRYDQLPAARLSAGYTWPLPRVTGVQASVHLENRDLMPDLAFSNLSPLDPGNSFFPFGEKPRYNDALYLASGEALEKPGAQVGLGIVLANPRRPQASWPLPPARPSPDLVVAWEYWNGSRWASVGTGVLPPNDLLLEPFQTPTDSTRLTLRGRRQGASIELHYLYPTDRRESVQSQGETWQTTLTDLDKNPTAFAVTALRRDGASASVGGVAFHAPPGSTPVSLSLEPVSAITQDQVVSIRGKVDAEKVRVGVHNAATGATTGPSAAADGEFEVAVTLDEGRNDLLVLVFDDSNRLIAGEVVLMVRQAPAPNGFVDTTWGLTRSGRVGFGLPPDAKPASVNGEPGNWLRARIVSGNYGLEAAYEPALTGDGTPRTDSNTGMPIFFLTPASFQPPSIRYVAFDYDYTSPPAQPEQALSESLFTTTRHDAPFTPYRPVDCAQPALYLGFERPGASTGFGNTPVSLYFGTPEAVRTGPTRQQELAGPVPVMWEYWNGVAWNRLGTQDETQGLTRRGVLTFVGPTDFLASTEFGRTAYWLRALSDHDGPAAPPQTLNRVLTNTVWATHGVTTENETLGSSNGDPGQSFQTTKAPVLPGERIEVREPELPTAAEREEIEAGEGQDAIRVDRDPAGRAREVWVRWHWVQDFYESGPRSRHYTLNRLTGRVRFGDGRRGLAPPQGLSNVRATWYRTGGGVEGNRPAGAVNELQSSLPYIDSVTNHEPAGGGSAPETREAVKLRGPKTLRHRDRATAIADFEDLAAQASPEVARVRAVAAHSTADAGSVGLIVVPRTSGPKPMPSLELLGRVESYVRDRLTPTATVWVRGPAWLKVAVRAELVPVHMEAASNVQAAVLARLEAFLHPLTGGVTGTGWAFGRRPHRSDLYALVEGTTGVDHVRRLAVTTTAEAPEEGAKYALVYSGAHEVSIVGAQEQ